VAEVVLQGGESLTAAHRAGVLHRDVKPGNVFLCDAPGGFRVKMLDFGLAKSLGAASGVTQAGLIVGTPAYMSPEQIQERELDERSDLYSLAAVSWELLTGKRLIRSTEIFDIFSEIVRSEAPPLSSQLPGIPPEVDAAFAAALHKVREKRPRQVAEWSERTAELLSGVIGRKPGWPEPLEVALPLPAVHDRTATYRTLPRIPV
jgi:serine/threonine protein kinase